MAFFLSSLQHLSDHDLLAKVTRLANSERHATAWLVASLAELDERRLYLGQGCSSLFTYCRQVLHLSEQAAYGRIQAARAAKRFPMILELLADGAIHLTAVGLLAPHLTEENQCEVLEAARHKSKRDIEHLVARLRPQLDVVAAVRKLPEQKLPEGPELPAAIPDMPSEPAQITPPAAPVCNPPFKRSEVRPLAPERYKVQFTIPRETYDKLRRAQDLLRHTIASGDNAEIFDRALTLLLNDLAKRKLAATSRPRPARTAAPDSRHIPAAVRREVWKRDNGRCAFVGMAGRCRETGLLEFHHVEPYAAGGAATVENIVLRCRGHNAYESEQYFGTLFAREERASFGRIPTGSGPRQYGMTGPLS